MDLGVKRKEGGDVPVASDAPKVSYPSFTVRDDIAKQLMESLSCKLGDEVKGEVTLRCTGQRQDQYGSSLDFDVISLDTEGEGDDSGDEETKVLGYKRPAPGEKPAPPVGAETLD